MYILKEFSWSWHCCFEVVTSKVWPKWIIRVMTGFLPVTAHLLGKKKSWFDFSTCLCILQIALINYNFRWNNPKNSVKLSILLPTMLNDNDNNIQKFLVQHIQLVLLSTGVMKSLNIKKTYHFIQHLWLCGITKYVCFCSQSLLLWLLPHFFTCSLSCSDPHSTASPAI